jgi:hypothetical protein
MNLITRTALGLIELPNPGVALGYYISRRWRCPAWRHTTVAGWTTCGTSEFRSVIMTRHFEIEDSFISEQNQKSKDWVEEDFAYLAKKLRRQNVEIENLVAKAESFQVAVPSWASAPAALASPASGPGRTARHLREARRLRHHFQTGSFDAGRIAAYSLGPARRCSSLCASLPAGGDCISMR